jgi:hypothetical protein
MINNKSFELEIVWKKGSALESEKYDLSRK